MEARVKYIYTTGLDLDHVIPFAPVPKNDREIDGPDDRSELVSHACEPSASPLCYQDQEGESSNCYPPHASCPSIITESRAVWQ
jgi:hypothetical protein